MKQLCTLLPVCFLLTSCGGGSSGGSNSANQGSLEEEFAVTTWLDAVASTADLWGSAGYLDSGLNAATGFHHGGGHGVLGPLQLDGLTLNTDQQSFYSELLGASVFISGNQGGVIFTRSTSLSAGAMASAIGMRPLRIYSRGSTNIQGSLDCSGESAPLNFGMYRPLDERLDYQKLIQDDLTPGMQALLGEPAEALGGMGGFGQCAAGDGGQGGLDWYSFGSTYYDDTAVGFYAYHSANANMSPLRFSYGLANQDFRAVHGRNGGGVGGVAALGQPLPQSAAQLLGADRDAGAGMGSWAWPPKSNRIPLESEVAAGTWSETTAGYDILAHHWADLQMDLYSRARSRGGGGGGYWTAGQRGDFHDPNAIDAFGKPTWKPDLLQFDHLGSLAVNWDFNGQRNFPGDAASASDREQWTSYLSWDQLAGGSIPDASGGEFVPAAGVVETFYTLDPAAGYLRGGAGGGGAGMSQHGSHNVESFGGLSTNALETYRGCDGGGGGAGGGAVQLHAGNQLTVTGQLQLSGGAGGDSAAVVGNAFPIDTRAWQYTLAGDAGGGGGSGGAILLQSGGALQLAANSLTLAGGVGGVGAVGNNGGQGGGGVLRLESLSPIALSDLQGVLEPLTAFDLAQRSEYGLSGGNWSSFKARFSGSLGDLTVPRKVGTGSIFFNGNASGVSSKWYEVGNAADAARCQGYVVHCLWSNGQGASGKLIFDVDQRTEPGITPVWIAVQTDASAIAGAAPEPWVLPGYNTVAGGADELSAKLMKRARFQLVFDHDLISAQIGTAASAYFHVTKVELPWQE